mgnify:CR=1 FL=1
MERSRCFSSLGGGADFGLGREDALAFFCSSAAEDPKMERLRSLRRALRLSRKGRSVLVRVFFNTAAMEVSLF